MIKNRDNIYLVVRVDTDWPRRGDSHVCGAYPSPERADEVADAFNQSWEDRGWGAMAKFEVRVTTYYSDE